MSTARKIPLETLEQQAKASNPAHSAWVSANAGSGKTHVLANRIVRLLLSGVAPGRILALTFTKTAAGEMAKRVFALLGKWAVMDNNKLADAIEQLEGRRPSPAQVESARRLFARALETPGGLKIQTIHAFCGALLQQFPLEANVPGNFSVLEERAAADLVRSARDRTVLDAQRAPATDPLRQAFDAMLDFASDDGIDKSLDEIVSRREEIQTWLDANGTPEAARLRTLDHLGFDANVTAETFVDAELNALEIDTLGWQKIAEVAEQSTAKTDVALAASIRAFLTINDPIERLSELAPIFLTKAGDLKKFTRYPTKQVTDVLPDAQDAMARDALRFSFILARYTTLLQIEATHHVMVFARAMLDRYRQMKRATGKLDFNDLIARTSDLLLRKGASAWVLYKLDRGIDHILLDEAQDTSPRQWELVDAMVAEFFSGKGANEAHRTVFAVGDEKQSIYSFQGAQPRNFSRQQVIYRKKVEAAAGQLKQSSLTLSFRSVPDVLAAVDTVFEAAENHAGLTADDDQPPPHQSIRASTTGRVEVWDRVAVDTEPEPDDWISDMDPTGTLSAPALLARRIADRIGRMLEDGETIEPDDGPPRRIRPGDIAILFARRAKIAAALTRALKERGIPVAGADRLAIADHIAVRDLVALGHVMLTRRDDLSLACVLRSPLIGFTDDELMELALDREATETAPEEKGKSPKRRSLYATLRQRAGTNETFARALEDIDRWRERAGSMPVFEFYARLLGEDRRRFAFHARLGVEVEEVLDAFLTLTLEHERDGLPGLLSFLSGFENSEQELKRDLAQAGDEVRVMTVHAAKGQEAPVVFLIDQSSDPSNTRTMPPLLQLGSETDPVIDRPFLWATTKDQRGDSATARVQELARDSENEYRRLLYVGMTRAEDRLIVCGYQGKNAPPAVNWHDMVSGALSDVLEKTDAMDEMAIRTMKPTVSKTSTSVAAVAERQAEAIDLPDWIGHRMKPEPGLPRPLNPSGASALIDESAAQEIDIPPLLETLGAEDDSAPSARLAGTAIHKVLQVWHDLDDGNREAKVRAYLETVLEGGAVDRTFDAIERTVASPDLAALFDPHNSRAEVPVMGTIDFTSGPRPVSGTIDRLAILPDRVIIADFKTSAHPPQDLEHCPPDYVTQMALYRALMTGLYPDRPVDCWLIWTHAPGQPLLMSVPHTAMDAALSTLTGM